MTSINRQPDGLLGFLGIKNGGRNPSLLADTLAPVWDLAPLYINAASEIDAGAYNIAGIGYAPAFVVPNNEIWYVDAFGVYSNAALGAGQTVRATPALRDPAGVIVLPVQDISPSITTPDLWTTAMPRPVLLQPGFSIGLLVSLVAGGPVACTANLRYCRFST